MTLSDASGNLADRWKKIQEKKAAQSAGEPATDFNELFTVRARILGVLIRDARQTRQRTTADLATSLGIREQTLLEWEYGTASPSLPQLELLAYDLGLPISHFWGTDTLARNGESRALPRAEYLLLRDRVLGAQLRQARQDAGLSVEDLSARIKLPAETIDAYELGREPAPLTVLTSIASAANVSVSFFLEPGNRIGQWLDLQEGFKRFSEMPDDVRAFISNPSNRSFVELAMWFSALGVSELRGLAESILNLSRLEQDKMRRIAEGILNDITL
jgi:transcriptional regulator with XRE-family HTH domain